MKRSIKLSIITVTVVFISVLFGSCGRQQYNILYEYYNSYNQFENKADTILGRVTLPILQFRSSEQASKFGNMFDELAKDTISEEYKLIVRADNDTIKFSIQDWSKEMSISEEIDFPNLNRGIIRHKTGNDTKEIFVVYDISSSNSERFDEIFKTTGKVERYELRRHYMPYKVTTSYRCDTQYYLGFYTNDIIVLLRKQERKH